MEVQCEHLLKSHSLKSADILLSWNIKIQSILPDVNCAGIGLRLILRGLEALISFAYYSFRVVGRTVTTSVRVVLKSSVSVDVKLRVAVFCWY